MTIMERECTFYNFSNRREIQSLVSQRINPFEEIRTVDVGPNILALEYVWHDPIKLKDKIVSKRKKSVYFFVFEIKGFICFFSNSESDTFYVISKLRIIFGLELEKNNLFNNFNNLIEDEKGILDLVVSIQINKEIMDYHKVYTLNKNEFTRKMLLEYFETKKLININLKCSGTNTFYALDCNSAISFNDTDTMQEILYVIENSKIFIKRNT